MAEMTCIGVLAHPLRPPSFPIAQQIKATLEQHGMHTWVYTEWQEQDVYNDVCKADMVIAIGGDGAMLRAARVCAPCSVPVLGINMGQLGFLTEIRNVDHWAEDIEKVRRGEYWIEKRSMIHAEVFRAGEVAAEGIALNDMVISGSSIGRMIQLDMYIDSDWATTYYADALVVATATGSTAYALALGGPILPPELNNILIIPAAPHLSMERPIILAEGACVEVVISESRGGATVTADGVTLCNLENGDRIRVQVSDHISSFVRLRGRNYFYRSLLDRLEPRVQRGRNK